MTQWPWIMLSGALTYIALVTVDFKVGPVPLKVLLTVAAVGSWLHWHRRQGTPSLPFTVPVLILGIGVPAGWLAVAFVRAHLGDPAQASGLHDALEQGSRFVYVLLYFPIVDWYRASTDESSHRIWLWPIYGLAALTWGLLVAQLLFGVDYGNTLTSGPFRGDIGETPAGDFRAFLINQVLFIPAMVLILSRIRLRGIDAQLLLATCFLLGPVVLSHTRGIWVGIVVGAFAVMLLFALAPRPDSRGRRVVAIFGTGLFLVALVVNSYPTIAPRAVDALTGGTQELSTGGRLAQAPKLLDGVARHPLVGSGLGATLPSGYRRSARTPWSYELSWIQLLFQVGVVGLAGILLAPLLAARRAWSYIGAGRRQSLLQPVGIASLGGLLFACGSNPYLMTSPGTAALAISMSLCVSDASAAGSRSPVGSAATR